MRRGDPVVGGAVAPGFEPVRAAFAENLAHRGEIGAACAAMVGGEPVVDLWGGERDPAGGRQWESDTLVLVFSTTKGLAAMAMAVAHSRGLFDLGRPVAEYWPEFAAEGKGAVTVRQLLAHQAGLCAVDAPLTPELLSEPEALAEVLARQKPAWEPGTRHGYHALTLGFYESELLRRTDPAGRTLSRYFAEEVARPLGLEFHIGLPDDFDSSRIAVLRGFHPLAMLLHLDRDSWPMVISWLVPGSLTRRAFSNPRVSRPSDFGRPEWRRVEFPAAGGIGLVRDIARAYGRFALGAPELGVGEATFREIVTPAAAPSRGILDQVLRVRSRFAFGWLKPSPDFRFGTNDAAFGTMGAGGSFAFADPEAGVGFAYAMNRMGFHVWSDPRERALREALYRCL